MVLPKVAADVSAANQHSGHRDPNLLSDARLDAVVIRETLERGQHAFAFRSSASRLDALCDEVERLEEQLEAAREALTYYAERRNHTTTKDGKPHLWTNDSYDGEGPGVRARAALATTIAESMDVTHYVAYPAKERDPALCRHGYDLTQKDECPLCKAQEALSEWEPARWCRRCGVYGCEHVLPAQSPAISPEGVAGGVPASAVPAATPPYIVEQDNANPATRPGVAADSIPAESYPASGDTD